MHLSLPSVIRASGRTTPSDANRVSTYVCTPFIRVSRSLVPPFTYVDCSYSAQGSRVTLSYAIDRDGRHHELTRSLQGCVIAASLLQPVPMAKIRRLRLAFSHAPLLIVVKPDTDDLVKGSRLAESLGALVATEADVTRDWPTIRVRFSAPEYVPVLVPGWLHQLRPDLKHRLLGRVRALVGIQTQPGKRWTPSIGGVQCQQLRSKRR